MRRLARPGARTRRAATHQHAHPAHATRRARAGFVCGSLETKLERNEPFCLPGPHSKFEIRGRPLSTPGRAGLELDVAPRTFYDEGAALS